MILILVGVALIAGAAGALYLRRSERAHEHAAVATETITCAEAAALARGVAEEVGAGNFRQRCEVVGAAAVRPGGVEMAPTSGVPAVWYRTKVTHKYWEMQESTQDGRTRRTRVERSETVSDDASDAPFTVQDATGTVTVTAKDADIDAPEQVLDRFEQHEGTSAGQGVAEGIFSTLLRIGDDTGTIGFQHEEWAIRPGTRLYVHGEVQDASGELAFGAPGAKGRFVVSTRSEEEVVASARRNARIAGVVGIVLVILGLGLVAAGVATAATAVPTATVATGTQATVVGAAGGWTAWSEPSGGTFALVVRAPDGTVSRPAVAPRGVPFDLDLGTDAAGRVVAAYSRCAREPQRTGGTNATAPNYATGRTCRLRVLDLATGGERSLGKARGTASEVLPSVGGRTVAFVAVGRSGRAELRARVRSLTRSVVLDRGTWARGSAGFAGGPASVDTDGVHAAVVWRYLEDEFHDFNAVLNVTPVSGKRRARQLSYGVNGEECSYDTVLAPTVAADKVTFLRSDGTAWQAQRGSAAVPEGARTPVTHGPAVFGDGVGGVVTSAALDGDRLVVAQTGSQPGVARGATTVSVYAAGVFLPGGAPIAFCS
ncbi:MAG: E3 ubiquitin ligase family protein [Solirubrobacteraceae bacterium]